MAILDNFKSKQFWVEVFKLSIIFFVLFMTFSILIDQFKNVLSGNFAQVYENVWADGKWKSDVAIKGAISFVYSIYMVSRRKKATPSQH